MADFIQSLFRSFVLFLCVWQTCSFVGRSHKIRHRQSQDSVSTSLKSSTSSLNFNKIAKQSIFHALVISSSVGLSLGSPALALEPLPPVPEAIRMQSPPEAQSEVVRLPDGVEYYDVKLGDANGPVAEEGKSVQFLWVLRRSNGYFVASSATESDGQPLIYRVGNRDRVIPGLDEGIRGMAVGGVRRISVPAAQAYVRGVEAQAPGPVPADFGPRRQIQTRNPLGEVWKFEVKVTKIK